MATNTDKRKASDMIATPPPTTSATIVCSSRISSGRSAVDGASYASVRDLYLTKVETEVAMLCTQGQEKFHQGQYSQSTNVHCTPSGSR
mmetsp:Transcript_44694/g.108384  ORF Transcript_44694/g.108384 Transcript_44694/m.108384 type:complete len:89 (+) Transcript_44694:177-443(+)